MRSTPSAKTSNDLSVFLQSVMDPYGPLTLAVELFTSGQTEARHLSDKSRTASLTPAMTQAVLPPEHYPTVWLLQKMATF